MNHHEESKEYRKDKDSIADSEKLEENEVNTKTGSVNFEQPHDVSDLPSSQSFLTNEDTDKKEYLIEQSIPELSLDQVMKKKLQELVVDGLVPTNLDGFFEENGFQVVILILISLSNNKGKINLI